MSIQTVPTVSTDGRCTYSPNVFYDVKSSRFARQIRSPWYRNQSS